MLLVLIPAAWLGVVMLLVVLCRMAARADAPPSPAAEANPHSVGDGLVLWEAPPASALAGSWRLQNATRRRQAVPPLRRGRPSARKRRIATHGVR
jgi:hypothetical protein